MYYRNLTIFLV
uniref:Uncharacterized protein n=1 Tax=Anguilla anguilla TaxID=7936 RepID=A0A0E9RGR6_ANGAN